MKNLVTLTIVAVLLLMCAFLGMTPMTMARPPQAPNLPQTLLASRAPTPRRSCACWVGGRCVCGTNCNCPPAVKLSHTKHKNITSPRKVRVLSSIEARPALTGTYTPAVTWGIPSTNLSCCVPQQGYQLGFAPMPVRSFTPSFSMPMGGGFRGGFGGWGGGMGMSGGGGGCSGGS